MASGAILGRGLIKQDRLAGDQPRRLVAVSATDVLMCAAQRERRSLFVIEERRFPFHAVMAFGAAGHIVMRELLSVGIFVAILALERSCFEIHVDQFRSQIWGFMTIDASRSAMCSKQRELCFGVIEAGKLFPRFRGMAHLAADRGAICANLLHSLVELPLVRIGVATRAA